MLRLHRTRQIQDVRRVLPRAWLCGNAGLRGRRNPDQLMPGSAPDCARVAAMRGSANVSGRRSATQMKRPVLISHEEKVY
jgi:hypothetical protein